MALGAFQPAHALVIVPSFDASWGGAPAGATTVVNNVIKEYEKDFSNPVTITVAFGWGELAGNSLTSGAATVFAPNDFPPPFGPATTSTLAQVKGFYSTAVGLQPGNTALATADAHLPATFTNPSGGSSGFFIPDAEYKALTGGALNADPIDGFTGYATNFCGGGTCPYDFTGGVPAADAIDFTAVVEHELSHAMGRVDYAFVGGGLPRPPFLTPLDFFKYDCATPNLDPTFAQTCFSIDGDATNPLGRTFSNSSDSADWFGPSGTGGDSFDAFIAQGSFASVSSADITEMCALGWNDCGRVNGAPEPGSLALLGIAVGALALRRRRKST